MAQAVQTNPLTITKVIHIIIGMSIMLLLPYAGSPEFAVTATDKLIGMGFPVVDGMVTLSLSSIGMQVICLFIGLIYLWTVVDTMWPSFLAIFLLGVSDYATMEQVLSLFMGSPTIVMMFFLFIYAAVLIRSQISVYLARWLMTKDFVAGKPWLLTGMLLFSTYIVATIDQVTSVFLMWPVMYSVFKEVGYKKGDKYVSFMVVGVVYMAVLCFATDAIKGGAFILVLTANSLAANPAFGLSPMNLAAYVLFGFIISMISILLLLFVMRFIYRVDVSPLKTFDIEILKANPLPPMNWKQKFTIVLFILLAAWMLGAGVIPATTAIGAFLNQTKLAVGVFILFLMLAVQYKGEPFLDFPATMGGTPWTVFFLIATAFAFGTALVAPSTNFSILVENVLRDFFQGYSFMALTIACVIIAIVITNFTNSVVTGLIFAPILAPLCATYGYDAVPLLACFFYIVLIALCTPAGSPYAALLFGNTEWMSKGNVVHYAIVVTLISFVCVICVGVPLAMFLF